MSSTGTNPTPLPEHRQPGTAEAPALAIGRLYERHERMVRALCQLLLRNATDAEDAAQQTFLSAFASLIDGTLPRNPAAWLATIARRECWARTTQRRLQPLHLDDTDAGSQGNSALDEAIRNADLAALWNAINELPRQQRAAFLLREFSGLTYSEVATALGASESAIESLLVRARRQLRDGLEPALKTANLIATPLLLLPHRLTRLLGPRLAGGTVAKAAASSATIKLAATASAGLIIAGSIDIGIHTLGDRSHPGAVTHTDPHDTRNHTPAEPLVAAAPAATAIPASRLTSRNQAHQVAQRTPPARVATTAPPARDNSEPDSTNYEPETTNTSPGGTDTTSGDETRTSPNDAQSPTASDSHGSTGAGDDEGQTTSSPASDTTSGDMTALDTSQADTTPEETTPAEPTSPDTSQDPGEPPQQNTPAAP